MKTLLHKYISTTLITIIFLTLTGFFFASKDEPLPNMPEGDTNPDAGIVITFDSNPERFLDQTGKNVRFTATKTPDNKSIYYLSTPIADFTSKKFTLLDEKLGFVADKIHKFSIRFDFDTHIWTSLHFYPFEPSKWGAEEEIRGYIEEWSKRLDDAGWERYKFKHNTPYLFPRPEKNEYKKIYNTWQSSGHRITLLILRADPKTYKLVKNHPKYNLRILLVNKSKLP